MDSLSSIARLEASGVPCNSISFFLRCFSLSCVVQDRLKSVNLSSYVIGERGLTNKYAFTYYIEEKRYRKELSRGPFFYSYYLYKRLDLQSSFLLKLIYT